MRHLLLVGVILATLSAFGATAEAPLALSLQLASPSVKLGEPIELSFKLRNRSDAPLLVADPATSPRPTVPPEDWGVILSVTGPDGRTSRLERVDEFAAVQWVRRSFFRSVRPGQALTGAVRLGDFRTPLLRGYERWIVHHPGRTSITEAEMNVLQAVFSRPGRYRLAGTYTNRVAECWEGSAVQPVDAWLGSVTSAPVEVQVVP